MFAPPDEAAHIYRAAAIGRGQWREKAVRTPLGSLSQVRVPGTYMRLSDASACFTNRPDVPADCARRVVDDSSNRPALTIAGRYPPLYYLLIAPATRLFPPAVSIYVMRLLTSAVCAAFFALAFVSAQSVGRWAILGVAAAATPFALSIGSVVNPNGLEIASAAALWAAAAAMATRHRLDNRLWAYAAVAFAVFANMRSLSVPLALLSLSFCFSLAGRDRLQALLRYRAFRPWSVLVGISTIVAIAWVALFGRFLPGANIYDLSWTEAVTRTWALFGQSVGWFGLYTPIGPHHIDRGEVHVVTAIVIWFLLWIGLLTLGYIFANKRRQLILGGLLITSVVLPIVVSMVLRPVPIGSSWQGRYSLPLWIGLPIVAGVIASTAPKRPLQPAWAMGGFALAFVAAQLLAFAAAARRYTVGAHGDVLYFLHPDWTGPVPSSLLLILALAASVALAWRVVTCPLPSRPRA
ncbi:MAG: DUF2142 domain-containing protein [Candidatus Dormibacteraeota bacterium]|nr:DUF2142 domain-containing protein [Candidatus Dormibacteraeota bacterium]